MRRESCCFTAHCASARSAVLLSEEAARLLQAMGAETRTFNPHGLPLLDSTPDTHEKVQELRQLAM